MNSKTSPAHATPRANWPRRWLFRFRLTYLHPQFFAYRYEQLRYQLAGKISTGLVLDIGCGRQPLRHHLTRGCDYFSLDYPNTGEAYNARPLVYGDAGQLPLKPELFDTVVCLELIEHVADAKQALIEARRVLKHGGRLIISAPFLYPIHDAPNDYTRWTHHGLEQLVKSAGLCIESIRTLGSPVETGILIANLGLAWQALNTKGLFKPALLLTAALTIPFLNLCGHLLSSTQRNSKNTPFAIGYMCVLKIEHSETDRP